MSQKSTFNGKKIMHNIWERDMTVRRWAAANGFKPDTVYKLLEYGTGGKRSGPVNRKILKRLEEQGLLSGAREESYG